MAKSSDPQNEIIEFTLVGPTIILDPVSAIALQDSWHISKPKREML